MILGALVSLIAAGAYAAADEIRVAHKIRSYRPTVTREQHFDTQLESKLRIAFIRNWNNEGATLYPPKLIPFLASDEKIRRLWVEATVWKIMGAEPPGSNLRGRERYLKFDGGWFGPQLYEYDFVARYYPGDWEKYQKYVEWRQEQTQRIQKSGKTRDVIRWIIFAVGILLIILGCCIIRPVVFSGRTQWLIFAPVAIGVSLFAYTMSDFRGNDRSLSIVIAAAFAIGTTFMFLILS